jgi:hypothetical protein
MVINLRRYGRQTNGRTDFHRPRRTRINMMRYRVFFNERDVTTQTFYVDSRRGIVRMFTLNDDGHIFVDPETHEVAREERRGHVRLSRRRP